jgi:hypothetical protein
MAVRLRESVLEVTRCVGLFLLGTRCLGFIRQHRRNAVASGLRRGEKDSFSDDCPIRTWWKGSGTLVGLNMGPPVVEAVVAVDETPQIQTLTAPPRHCPCCYHSGRATLDYERDGTDLFTRSMWPPEGNHRHPRVSHQRRQGQAPSLGGLRRAVNSRHTRVPPDPSVHHWLLRYRRFPFHFTPTYRSWMNLVERWFAAAHH